MSFEEYQAWAPLQPERWEYIGGEVYAMAGARRVHNMVTLNVGAALRLALRGTPCMPYVADMQVHVAATQASFYPDVVVSCDERDAQADLVLEHPRLLVEVLSDSTAAHDRGTRFSHYRQLPSLQEFLLLDPDRRTVELYSRSGSGWLLQDLTQAEHLSLCGATLPVADLFADLPERQGSVPSAPAAPPA
jgi:Uma2 family endonuclease